jgi:hypothetical protein
MENIFINIKKWGYSKLAMLSLAMSNVEKNSLGQSAEPLSTDTAKFQRHTQGQLADSLINGEVTQEVIDMRWRTYKIIRETEGVTAEIVGYDENGMPIVKTRKRNKKAGLKKVKLDEFDSYPLEMIIDNSEIVLSGNQAMDNDNISIFDEVIINQTTGLIGVIGPIGPDGQKDVDGEPSKIEWSASHGSISGTEYFATNKSERPIILTRLNPPKFKLENFTKKLNIRTINKTEKLLEFYVSKYPDEYNRTSRLFISDIKKAILEPEKSTILEFSSVNFITYKCMGVDDFLEFEYEIISFDKIIEYNGFYVVKFIAKVNVNGVDMLEKHRVVELDKKYENKQKK